MKKLITVRGTHIGHLLTPEILAELDRMWPDRCPSPKDPEMVIKCAQREVINVLWAKWRDVNERDNPQEPT